MLCGHSPPYFWLYLNPNGKVLLGATVWRLGMSYLVFCVTGRPLFMVMCSAVVAMAASFPETADCWNNAEINSWNHLQSQKCSYFENKNLEEVLLSCRSVS